jgi:hypothetical protein
MNRAKYSKIINGPCSEKSQCTHTHTHKHTDNCTVIIYSDATCGQPIACFDFFLSVFREVFNKKKYNSTLQPKRCNVS